MKKMNELAVEMFAEQERIVKVIKNDLLWNIEQFHLGATTSFECIEQIKEKVKEL